MNLKRRFFKTSTGQAILELAIFGSVFLMLLAVLVQYGLRYNYQQEVTQDVFRLAMQSAAQAGAPPPGTGPAQPSSVTEIKVVDRYIPNPTDPMAIGTVMQVSSSANVVRNPRLELTDDTAAELPVMRLHMVNKDKENKDEDVVIKEIKTSGMRDEEVAISSIAQLNQKLDKYRLIYGDSSVWRVNSAGARMGDTEGIITYASSAGVATVFPIKVTLRIIDRYDGQIVDYEGAKRQCRQLTDTKACEEECTSSGGENCFTTCSAIIKPPWYCDKDVLDKLVGPAKTMGIQPHYTQTITKGYTLGREETQQAIKNISAYDWSIVSNKSFSYRELGDNSGDAKSIPITTTISDKKTNEVITPWQKGQ